jgi:uncharacterized protein YnzC (UPF0291/DUF896 family)
MSKENVRKFYELLINNPAVANELKNSVDVCGEADAEKTVAFIIGFAAEKGFEFTGEELAEFELENQQELTPEEKEEQKALREEYIKEFRASFRGILSNTVVQYPDGSKKSLEALKNEKKEG